MIAQGSVIRNSTIADNTVSPGAPGLAPFVTSAGIFASQFDVVEHSTIADNKVAEGASLLTGTQVGVIATTSLSMVLQSSIVDGGGQAPRDASLLTGAQVGVISTTSLSMVLQVVDRRRRRGKRRASQLRPRDSEPGQQRQLGPHLWARARGRPRRHVDPQLGPLTDNGGPTDTMALKAGSPAIDAGADPAVRPTSAA